MRLEIIALWIYAIGAIAFAILWFYLVYRISILGPKEEGKGYVVGVFGAILWPLIAIYFALQAIENAIAKRRYR